MISFEEARSICHKTGIFNGWPKEIPPYLIVIDGKRYFGTREEAIECGVLTPSKNFSCYICGQESNHLNMCELSITNTYELSSNIPICRKCAQDIVEYVRYKKEGWEDIL